MSFSIGEITVRLIVGALAGTLAGRLVTFYKARFRSLDQHGGVGMLGAVIRGFLAAHPKLCRTEKGRRSVIIGRGVLR